MRWTIASLAGALAAAAIVAGCHGARIFEAVPDGGGMAGGAGHGGAGGSAAGAGGSARGGAGGAGGGARGGAGGAACGAQLRPVMFADAFNPPGWSDSNDTTYFWTENETPYITVHDSPGSPVASDNRHPFMIDAGSVNLYNVAVSNSWLVATWDLDGKVAAYGLGNTSSQVGSLTLTNPGAVAAIGEAILLAYDPKGGSPTPGIYTWNPPNPPTLFESYAQLGVDSTLGRIVRATAFHLLLSDRTNVMMADLGPTTPARMLFRNPGTRTIFDVRPLRPHITDGEQGGVLVQLQDNMFLTSGRDYYVNVLVPDNPPTDLVVAVNALADASACGSSAHYQGSGVLSLDRYIYEGQSGLFMVEVDQNGGVSKLVRLTDLPLAAPEVTGFGDLFAGRMNGATAMWEFYRVGNP